jgi:hypothetical protein
MLWIAQGFHYAKQALNSVHSGGSLISEMTGNGRRGKAYNTAGRRE